MEVSNSMPPVARMHPSLFNKEANIVTEDEEAVAFLACEFSQDSVFAKITDQCAGRIGLHIQQGSYLFDADHRILIEMPDEGLGIFLPAEMEVR